MSERIPDDIGIGELEETDPAFKTIVDFANNRIEGHKLSNEQLDFFDDALIYFYLGMINNRYPNRVRPDSTRAAKDELVKRELISREVGMRIEAALKRYEERHSNSET